MNKKGLKRRELLEVVSINKNADGWQYLFVKKPPKPCIEILKTKTTIEK